MYTARTHSATSIFLVNVVQPGLLQRRWASACAALRFRPHRISYIIYHSSISQEHHIIWSCCLSHPCQPSMAADAVQRVSASTAGPWSPMSWVISPMIVVCRWETFLNPFSFAHTRSKTLLGHALQNHISHLPQSIQYLYIQLIHTDLFHLFSIAGISVGRDLIMLLLGVSCRCIWPPQLMWYCSCRSRVPCETEPSSQFILVSSQNFIAVSHVSRGWETS
jgi:hypothetical protein